MELEEKHAEGIQEVRNEYSKALEKEINSRRMVKDDALSIKKQY